MNKASNVAIAGLVFVLAYQGYGLLNQRWSEWVDEKEEVKQIREVWAADSLDRATILEFVDYQCTYCRMVHPEQQQAVSEGAKVAIRHLPAPSRPLSIRAAAAVICSEPLGREKAFHDLLMEDSGWMAQEDPFIELASQLGVEDLAGFSDCLSAPAIAERLEADSRLASRLGAAGTPTFVGWQGMARGYQVAEGIVRLAPD